MDRYKFRGKRLDTGYFSFGDLIDIHDGRKYIINNLFGACIDNKGNFINTEAPFVNEVNPSTVGQYTGLKDKNGNEIYEGDIVKQTYEKSIRDDDNCWYTTSGNHIGVAVVDKHNGVCIKNPVRYTDEDGEKVFQKGNRKSLSSYRTEIIGNIHDNKELLEG